MKFVGTLRHLDVEGGVWLLSAENGRQYQLVPPPTGHAAGARVEVEGEADAGGVSFQMTAPILRVRSLRKA